jgi:uncharacterized repeat protein (TIGR03847 family)
MTDDLGTVVLMAGAVGRPGQRTFYLQAHATSGPITVKCEKQQVEALAEYLERLLADLPAVQSPAALPDELTPPVDPRFVLGSIGLAYDEVADRFVVVLEEITEEADDDAEDAGRLSADDTVERDGVRLELTRDSALVFCARARDLVAAGRPSCRFCGRPMDPDGHFCPRMN